MTQQAINQEFIEKINLLSNVGFSLVKVAKSINITRDKLYGIKRGNNASKQLLENLDNTYPEIFKKDVLKPNKSEELEKRIEDLEKTVEELQGFNKLVLKYINSGDMDIKEEINAQRERLNQNLKEREELRKKIAEKNKEKVE